MRQARTGLSPAKIFGRPTADRLWLGPAQRRALTFLRTPIQGTTKLLLGPRGCGKSTLLDAFLEELEGTLFFKSRDRWDSGSALLQALLSSAGLMPAEANDVERRNLFSSYLNHQHSLGNRIAILVDDAEQLTSDVWRELYRLRAIRCGETYEPEFILVGRPETYGFLQSSSGGGWESMRLITHTLKAFESADLGEYIVHRLRAAGLAGEIFTPSARDHIGHLANGSLKGANLLCQVALVHARKHGSRVVDERIVRSARMSMGDQRARSREKPGVPGARPSPAGVLLVSRDDQIVARYPLSPHMLVGSSESSHVRLEGRDVSRHHAAIVKTPRGYEIVDLDSAGGFSVNGEPVLRRVLGERDIIALGGYRLELVTPMVSNRKPPRAAVVSPVRPSGVPQTP